MKHVPTTAPPEVAATAIRERYAGLVHPRLLDEWAASPSNAPGRPVSSPWPDRIDVDSMSVSDAKAVVAAHLVEATSTGEARRAPIQLRLEKSGESWLITGYQATGMDAEAAVATIHDYYRAIASGDFRRAYSHWGSPGQSLDSFAKGFADTSSVQVKTGTPSRIEPAAGSRYIDVPVTIRATTKSGRSQRFEGTYTLRRSVVDGATRSEREWHIDRAAIEQVTEARH